MELKPKKKAPLQPGKAVMSMSGGKDVVMAKPNGDAVAEERLKAGN